MLVKAQRWGGEKINCHEVEQIAVRHLTVSAITVGELGTFLEEQGLAKFKFPERIEIVSEFPMTSSGKLSKPILREKIKQTLAEEATAASRSP